MKYIDATQIRSITVLQLGKLGDLILTLPLFHYLKVLFPPSRLTVICRPPLVEIAQICPAIDRVVTWNKKVDTLIPSAFFF